MFFVQLILKLFIGSGIIWIITGNIMQLIALVKCFGKKRCCHIKCPYKVFCYREPNFQSEEYAHFLEELEMMIADRKKELNINCPLETPISNHQAGTPRHPELYS